MKGSAASCRGWASTRGGPSQDRRKSSAACAHGLRRIEIRVPTAATATRPEGRLPPARGALVPQYGCAPWVTRRMLPTDVEPACRRLRERRTRRRQDSRVSGSLPRVCRSLRLHDHPGGRRDSPCEFSICRARSRRKHGPPPSSLGRRGSTGGEATPCPAVHPRRSSRVHESSVRVHPARCQCCAIACSTMSSRARVVSPGMLVPSASRRARRRTSLIRAGR